MSETATPSVVDAPSSNHDARPAGVAIDMLVLHYTDMASCAAALERLCDPASKVSAHYLVGNDGCVFHLVPEARRAWHAGESFWRGQAGVNARSVGIELDNAGHSGDPAPFPEAQMAALIELCRGILARHAIPSRNVVGHSDVAPRRKQDPGALFDWRRLAAAGIGSWPDDAPPEVPDAIAARARLSAIGYETVDMAASLAAFQRHFRPVRIDGMLDGATMGLLGAVLALCEAA